MLKYISFLLGNKFQSIEILRLEVFDISNRWRLTSMHEWIIQNNCRVSIQQCVIYIQCKRGTIIIVCMVHKCIVYQKCIMSISVPPIVLHILEGSSNNDRNDNCYVLHDLCTLVHCHVNLIAFRYLFHPNLAKQQDYFISCS